MTFPLGTVISTDHLVSADNDPNLARIDLLALVNAFNLLIASAGTAEGAAVLNVLGQIPVEQLPTNWGGQGDLTLQPGSKIVNVRDILRMTQVYVVDLPLYTLPQLGDTLFLVDGDAGQPCLSVYDGTNWRVVRLMTQVGDVGAAMTFTSALTATAVI
jgi:hypothetical protein